MEIKDLRIGNFVKFRKEENQIALWHYLKIAECLIGEDEIEPIPLTEEWLLKFGFEKIEYSDERHGFGNEYNLKVNEDIFFNYSDDFSLCIYRSEESMEDEVGIIPEWGAIQHVHQLQNLYYSLTGKEIIIRN